MAGDVAPALVIGGGIGSSTSQDVSTSYNDTHNIAVTDNAYDTYGSKAILGSGSSIGTFSTSDYGALQTAREIAESGARTSQYAIGANLTALDKVAALFALKGEDPLIQIVKPLGFLAVAIYLIYRMSKGGKKKGGSK